MSFSKILSQKKKIKKNWGYSLTTEHLPGIHETLSSNLGVSKEEKEEKEEEEEEEEEERTS